MNKAVILIIFNLIIFSAGLAQTEWDPAILEKANTAKDTRYMKEEEKLVIYYTNLARTDGQLFADTYLTWYIDSADIKPNSYTKSLYKDLKKVKNLPLLYPQGDLYEVAREHATKSGKSGYEGHKSFKSRFKPLMTTYSYVGENCYYGQDNALIIVIKLLIDEGVEDLGHRYNLLSANFNSVGVSAMPHKQYGSNCVMDFGRK